MTIACCASHMPVGCVLTVSYLLISHSVMRRGAAAHGGGGHPHLPTTLSSIRWHLAGVCQGPSPAGARRACLRSAHHLPGLSPAGSTSRLGQCCQLTDGPYVGHTPKDYIDVLSASRLTFR